MIRAIALLTLYAVGMTLWALGEADRTADRIAAAVGKSRDALAEQIRQAALLQQQTRDEGERVRTEIETVFVPIKEQVRVVETVFRCDGEYPDRVRMGLEKAASAANSLGGLPPAGYISGPSPAGGKH